MMESGLIPKFVWLHGAHDPNPNLILPPLLVYATVDQCNFSTRCPFWIMHGLDKILRLKNFLVHILYFPLSHLCFCRMSDMYHYLREKVAGGTPFCFSGLSYSICSVLIKVLKHLWVLLSKKAKPGQLHQL